VIAARKGGPLGSLWAAYANRKFRRAFHGLWARGDLPDARQGSLLVYANHANFWDGFVACALSGAVGWSAYCLMEERQLVRYRFLRRMGAFSIRRGEARSALETIRYMLALLKIPGNAVFVFPQGKMSPFGGPLVLEPGVELLARRSGARCLPLAIRYEFLEHEHPEVLVDCGEPHLAAPLAGFTERLSAGVARLAAVRSTEGFRRLLVGRSSVAERWDRVRGIAPEGGQR